jgi:hypothetical protein
MVVSADTLPKGYQTNTFSFKYQQTTGASAQENSFSERRQEQASSYYKA